MGNEETLLADCNEPGLLGEEVAEPVKEVAAEVEQRRPRVQVVNESFLTVPVLVAGSDRIALLQRRLVNLLPLDTGIRALPCPFDAGPLIEAMWWHPVYDDDPEHAWLRDLVVRAARQAVGADATAP